jgi:K+-sensing histidine kinase KdpD
MWRWFNSFIAMNTFSENAAHVLAGYAAVLTVAFLHGRLLVWTVVFLVAASFKEYVYDFSFETPHQTFRNNSIDFLGYCVGLALGLGASRL